MLALTACSGTGDVEPARDAGVSSPFTAQAGFGRLTFEPITGTETLPLIVGPQGGGALGGYHIWTAVRMIDIRVDEIDAIKVTLTTTSGVQQSEVIRRPDGLPFDVCDGAICAAGFAPRLMDCCQVSDGCVVIGVEVTAKDGRTSSDEATTGVEACPPC